MVFMQAADLHHEGRTPIWGVIGPPPQAPLYHAAQCCVFVAVFYHLISTHNPLALRSPPILLLDPPQSNLQLAPDATQPPTQATLCFKSICSVGWPDKKRQEDQEDY